MSARRERLLITGASGFLGQYLVIEAQRNGYEVWQCDRHAMGLQSIQADLSKPGRWQDKVQALKPEIVVHLAGLARSRDLEQLNSIHVEGTQNLIASLDGVESWIALASSGSVYGEAISDTLPWFETSPCNPLSNYATSKFEQEKIAIKETAIKSSLRLCIVRISNLVGPGQSDHFLLGRIINTFARFNTESNKSTKSLETGSLEATRDFIDVRDVVNCFMTLISKRSEGTFNLASGREIKLRDAVKYCQSLFEIQVHFRENSNFYLSDITRQAFDISALYIATGWSPKYTLKESLIDMAFASRELHN
jgi:nucleoside-diphosphate-sugar epimerase